MTADILIIGETLIDIVRRPGAAPTGFPGGSPLNVAIGLGRLGQHPLLACWYGRDDHGAMIEAHCATSGVDILPGSDQAIRTPTADALLDAAGHATYTFDIDSRLPELPADLAPRLIHVGSISAVTDPGGATALAYVEAHRGRAYITYDPNCRPSIMGEADAVRGRVERYVAAANLVKVSDEDLAWLYPGATTADGLADQARRWLAFGPDVVVVTRGAAGATAYTAGGTVDVPADTAHGLVDTVGAGDSFMAGLIFGLMNRRYTRPGSRIGTDLDEVRAIVAQAAAISGITVSRAGANPPWADELRAAGWWEPWLARHTHALLDFALKSQAPEGGFGWQDDDGVIDRSQGRHLWINCRMTHVAAIGTLLGHPGCREAVDHGVAALSGLFQDQEYGGWYAELGWEGQPTDPAKAAYAHAFVILAASSAAAAGCAAAWPLLREALVISETRFWDETYGMVAEEWDRSFTRLDPYRGVNANMHTVEAYLAAADVLERAGEAAAELWRERALRITSRVINQEARANNWRIPEHFDATWTPHLDLNRDRPADQFRPYGATIGHGLEWTRLTLQAHAAAGARPELAWMPEAALALFERALGDGWAADGADGFVYTVDWDGTPVVHERMYWVLAEAIGAGAALAKAGLRTTTAELDRWWRYADTYFIDHERGGWREELDRQNHPSATVWSGKPDTYHVLQATLIPYLPLTPAIVPALAARQD
ncbi:MAG: PfkB family carbohydrate kinase [Propionibacteriaceae bacterium]|jgi:mannose/cellobiose epimerase-like protein (N-acyl-D-glucosamine 2-epimerase family)/sugar/nucleoside kinase (ribokinase family)|nr:PfkB family carbohydrate kinase [Propionibacteriaceae bacterium]